ncbi:carbohydrate ABC transporter permease [Microlunatus parietis]|uniref:Multiple sugar transport system permease protein n=1 Tax=Microlunatus parietis TaxID=682979 RepID=A0A7Y9L9E0_9ACTN|nr:sugar ABC transporter permease [Microlunatus parietis]NYE71684.1 multiple sugar transport system permease protein [Microlunatus parietis]
MTILQPVLARRTRRDWIAYAFIAPAVVVLALVVGIPALTTLGFSFTDVTFLRPTEFVGLRNYLTLIGDPVFGQALWNTLYYTVGVTVPTMALGLGTAMLLNVRYPGRNVFRAILYLPVLVSIAAAAMVWIYLYDPDLGPINGLMQSVGLPTPRWLQSPSTAMPALIVMGIWRDYGTSMLLYLAGLQNVPEEVREAARIDGAGPARAFWSVILPLLRPVTFYLVVLTVTGSFQVFGSIYIMTQGGPIGSTSTVVYQIFENAFSYSDFGYSSAMSVVLFVLILVFSIAGARLVNGRER